MFAKWFRWLSPPPSREVNTVYFTCFLLFVASMSLAHFFVWDVPLSGIPLFFLIHAIGQCFLESGTLLLIGFVLKRWLPNWLFSLFIGLSFAILLAHFINFTMIRLMDATFSYAFKYLFGSGFAHIVTVFQAINMNGNTVVIAVVSLLLIPLVGIAFYRATEPLARKIAWKPSASGLALTLLAIGSALFTLDLLYHPFLNPLAYAKYQKALPMGTTFISPSAISMALPRLLTPARDEMTTRAHMAEKQWGMSTKPNIYIVVIESLRNDFITPEIAPNLHAFGQTNVSFAESFANANGTHPSWFAIFHADYPYHWTHMRDHWQHGSIPLQILKDCGYKIRAYSSADLHFFNMDELLFGKGRKLADEIEEYSQDRLIEPWQRDEQAVNALLHAIDKEGGQSGNVFLLFLDSTHSEYSVPPHFPQQFQPIVQEIDYLTLTPQHLEPIKNRYRNSIAYIDSLAGKIFNTLKAKGLYDESIFAITGDHGEEFFEEGALFHGTHLNKYQTNVPLFYKFQNNPLVSTDTCTTHLDIFPSILHFLTGQNELEDLFDGRSIFTAERHPYRICVLQNGLRTPAEFLLERGPEKWRLRFPDGSDIYKARSLEVLSSEGASGAEGACLEQMLERR